MAAGVGPFDDDDVLAERGTFGAEAERLGTKLDEATKEFLEETKSSRALQIPPGNDYLTAMEFVAYLGIDLELEPELAWVAREMLAAPMPPNAKLKQCKSGVCYFHDVEKDYFTFEHPLTQRYLKVLERARLDLICLRTKPSVNRLLFGQPDMLFHQQFRNLQIPCQSCGVMQSTLKCNQCLMSFCQACFDALHKHSQGPRKNHTVTTTACGSVCSTCSVKKPQVFCANFEDYFCFRCFEELSRGRNRSYQATYVNVSDGEIIEPDKKCEECGNNLAAFACDYCLDSYCVPCYWKCHFNGHRRTHTASKVNVVPMCNQCTAVRATVFCEQTQELMCTECFTSTHCKGNRMLHLFMNAMDLLELLERLDPTFQEHMRRARPRILSAISQLQGWTKAIADRRKYKRRIDLATQIQRRWRGIRARRQLLGMLNMHKWRRRQVNAYFLPRTADDRRAVRQKVSAMLKAKDVTQRAANAQLRELKKTILDTTANDPLEDRVKTWEALNPDDKSGGGGPGGQGGASVNAPNFSSQLSTTYEKSRFSADNSLTTSTIPVAMNSTLSTGDPRNKTEKSLREITMIGP